MIRFQLRTLMAQKRDRGGEKITYRLLSEKTGISSSTLSRIASNQQVMISLSVLERLCRFLECTPNDLIWIGESEDDD